MKALRVFAVALLLACVYRLTGQEISPGRVKEYGLGLSGLNYFSLQYRWGNTKYLKRLAATVSANYSKSNMGSATGVPPIYPYESVTPMQATAGLLFTFFRLRPVSEKFGTIAGPVLGTFYGYSQAKYRTELPADPQTGSGRIENETFGQQHLIIPSLGMSLGCYYMFTPSFYVHLEIQPGVWYSFGELTTRGKYTYYDNTNVKVTSTEYTQKSYQQNFGAFGGNLGALLTVAHRITR
jgi:hypothetical protein